MITLEGIKKKLFGAQNTPEREQVEAEIERYKQQKIDREKSNRSKHLPTFETKKSKRFSLSKLGRPILRLIEEKNKKKEKPSGSNSAEDMPIVRVGSIGKVVSAYGNVFATVSFVDLIGFDSLNHQTELKCRFKKGSGYAGRDEAVIVVGIEGGEVFIAPYSE